MLDPIASMASRQGPVAKGESRRSRLKTLERHMRVCFVFGYMDNRHRLGRKYDGPVQPMTGTLIAALLPGLDVEVVHDNSPDEIDWNRSYDLLFISSIHSDFDRARQISHYFRRRGAKTVYGGFMASTYPHLCQ